MKATPIEIEKYLKLIEETPHFLAQATEGMDDAFLRAKSEKKSWSANDILAHLRSCADIWTYSIYAMLAAHDPELPDINERKWANVTCYAALPFAKSLEAFSLQRENLLWVLKALPFEAWEKSAMIFGRKHTIFTQTRRLAKHETEHCEQIKELLSAKSS